MKRRRAGTAARRRNGEVVSTADDRGLGIKSRSVSRCVSSGYNLSRLRVLFCLGRRCAGKKVDRVSGELTLLRASIDTFTCTCVVVESAHRRIRE